MRLLLSIALLAAAASPALAIDSLPSAAGAPPTGVEAAAHPEPEWRSVVEGQILAFRTGDAPAAFGYAGSAFQKSFPDAVAFFRAIVVSGYAPIMTSRSHSFGGFREEGRVIHQSVRLVGANQELYEAVYQLANEQGVWRVQGVQLRRIPGIGI